MDEKIGMEARINTTLATLVFDTAKTNAGAVEPISNVYNHPSHPIIKIFLKLFQPPKMTNPKKTNIPEDILRQKVVAHGSTVINRTNKESGTTSMTPKKVINNPLVWSVIAISKMLSN